MSGTYSHPAQLHLANLQQMLKAIDSGETTTEAIINACYDRIDEREADVGAWQYRLSRAAIMAEYKSNQHFYDHSPLKGLPVGIKDIIDTADMPTEMGSAVHAGRQPAEDASCVALIRAAGGIILGKTVTTEFAYFKPGKTHNPAALSRTPGGSSSGSAAAVADGMVPLALGSQTAASVIRPAAYCGTVGYVGSRGEFSLRGGQPLAQSLDSLGLFARSVEDIAFLRALLLRQPAEFCRPVTPSRVVICGGDQVGDTDAAMNDAMTTLGDKLTAAGTEVIILNADGRIQAMLNHHAQIMAWEVCRNLVLESQQADKLSEPLQQLIQTGLSMPREHYTNSLQATETTRNWLWSKYAEADVIIAPAAPGVAPAGHDKTGAPHMSRPWQAMGLPVITLPGMTDDNGLPLGIQLIGRARDDDRLLQQAAWMQTLLAG